MEAPDSSNDLFLGGELRSCSEDCDETFSPIARQIAVEREPEVRAVESPRRVRFTIRDRYAPAQVFSADRRCSHQMKGAIIDGSGGHVPRIIFRLAAEHGLRVVIDLGAIFPDDHFGIDLTWSAIFAL